jgi:hypothetical protein
MTKPLLILLSALTIGCTHRSPEADTAPSGCNGRRDVVVTNNWSEPVEVFSRIGAAPAQYVGTVAAGRQTLFKLPDGARFASVQPTGSTTTQPAMPAASRDLVDLRYLCE